MQNRPPGRLAKRAVAIHRKLARQARRRQHVVPGALLLEARLRDTRGQTSKAETTLRRACQSAIDLKMPPFEALARFDLARMPSLSDEERRTNIERAIDLFERMGYRWHLERALALEQQIARPQERKLL